MLTVLLGLMTILVWSSILCYRKRGGEFMKSKWLQPSMEELNISETAGGPVYNNEQDGPSWYDGKAWQTPSGTTLS